MTNLEITALLVESVAQGVAPDKMSVAHREKCAPSRASLTSFRRKPESRKEARSVGDWITGFRRYDEEQETQLIVIPA
jgi:hypothetical protein